MSMRTEALIAMALLLFVLAFASTLNADCPRRPWLLRFALIGIHPRPKVVTTVHGLNSVSAYSRIMTWGDRVIAVSRATADFLLEHYPRLDTTRVRIIPRGADPAEFPPRLKVTPEWCRTFGDEYPGLKGGRLLTLPGRGTRLKGHADAIAILARVRQAGVDARLLWFADENHWILKPRNSKLWYGEFFAWLKRHAPSAGRVSSSHPPRSRARRRAG